MVILTAHQANALTAFMECFDLYTTGAWAQIETGMRDEFGIANPEADLEDARRTLRGEAE